MLNLQQYLRLVGTVMAEGRAQVQLVKRSREEELVEADSAAKGSRRESQGVELLSEGEGGEVKEELVIIETMRQV